MTPSNPDRLVTCRHLKKCQLWIGSQAEISWKYGGLTTKDFLVTLARARNLDDPTPAELEWRAALEITAQEEGLHV